MAIHRRTLAFAVYVLAAGNIAALWIARGSYVPGWDLFGATFGVLALNETGSFSGGLARVTQAFLDQKHRPVFTGGESYVHGLLPGLLNDAVPWLLWGHLVCLLLLIAIVAWLARRLPCRAHVLWACILASPALVSQSIVGLPHLTSTAIPFGLAIGYCLSESRRRRHVLAGAILDVVAFAGIAFFAFNGYESGKTFFVVPVVAALTLPRISTVRRIMWLACAAVSAWLSYQTQAMTTEAALAAVPHDVSGFIAGLARIPRRYLIDWWIDFPALLFAAVVSLFLLRAQRLFWMAIFAASLGLVSLSAFQFEGGFLSPHRFLLLIFVCAFIVAVVVSDRGVDGLASGTVVMLLCTGIAYSTYVTARFVAEKRTDERRDYNQNRIYPLPYNHSSFENQLWRDRIHDAITTVDLVKRGTEPHVFLYGFTAIGEDGVNPQLFVSRVLLPLGYRRFVERVAFFDHANQMFFSIVDQAKSSGQTITRRAAMTAPGRPQSAFPKA